jgi:hypothetical protein
VVQARRKVNGRVADEVFVENAHESIIPKQQWLEVQKMLEENTNDSFFNKKKASRRLQNLLYCNCCGRKRYLQCDGTDTDFIKSCSYKIDNNKCQDRGHKYLPVEKFVLQKIKEKKPDFEEKLKNLKSLDTTDIEKNLSIQRSSFEKQLEKFDKRQRNLTVMRMDGEISKADFIEMRDENEQQIKQIQQQIELIDTQVENLKNTDEDQQRLEHTIKMLDSLDKLEYCNTFLKTFIKKIWFSSNSVANHNTKRTKEKATIKIEWS